MKTKKILQINGMHCTSCERLITMDLASIHVNAHINATLGRAEVTYDPTKVNDEQIIATIRSSGYTGSFITS